MISMTVSLFSYWNPRGNVILGECTTIFTRRNVLERGILYALSLRRFSRQCTANTGNESYSSTFYSPKTWCYLAVIGQWEIILLNKTSFVSRSQLTAKFFNFLDENRLISVVLSGRFQRLERDFDVLFWPQRSHLMTRSLQLILLQSVPFHGIRRSDTLSCIETCMEFKHRTGLEGYHGTLRQITAHYGKSRHITSQRVSFKNNIELSIPPFRRY